MKRITFVLFFISSFVCSSAFSQGADIALFPEENPSAGGQKPCTVCTKAKRTLPNIGSDARPVDSIKIAPSPFPEIKVSMTSDEPLPGRPFEGTEMVYEKRYSSQREDVYSDLSAPVDFSKKKNPTATGAAGTLPKLEVKDKVNAVLSKKTEIPKPEKRKELEKPVFKPLLQSGVQAKAPVVKTATEKTFNIAELYLGMTPEDVIDVAAETGFEVSNLAYNIPSFMVSDFEQDCRASGLYQLRLIHECVRDKAREEDVYYISQLVLKKIETKEQIVVLFSSALTGNKAFKIDYTGFGDNSLGTSYKDLLKKTNRRDVFWKYVYDKYGKPKTEQAFWGDLNGISLRAFLDGNAMDARIVLQNFDQTGKDYRQAEKENKVREVEEENPFSF